MRGNLLSSFVQSTVVGSIPACAGEPIRRWLQGRDSGVYPRVCGGTRDEQDSILSAAGLSPRVRGNEVIKGILFLGAGLSPRVRGNRSRPPSGDDSPGSIPACAGEPLSRSAPSALNRVYPRVCGGTNSSVQPFSLGSGLSPRVRGNPRCPQNWQTPPRSIPACAGEPA